MTQLLAQHPGELRRLAELYGWDMNPDEAPAREARVLLRTMDIGVWEDMLLIESLVGRPALRRIVQSSPAGALSPRSWSFWHYRLGLVSAGARVPPRPVRRIA